MKVLRNILIALVVIAVIAGGVIIAAAAASVGIAAVSAVGAAACATNNACSKIITGTGGATGEIALDTNAVIAAIEGGPVEVSAVTNAMAGRTPVIPPTVANEFLTRGSSSVLNNFIQNNNGRIGSTPLLSQVLALQQQAESLGRSLRTPDASVAASALKDGVSLLTADVRLVNTLRAIGVSVEHLVIRN